MAPRSEANVLDVEKMKNFKDKEHFKRLIFEKCDDNGVAMWLLPCLVLMWHSMAF